MSYAAMVCEPRAASCAQPADAGSPRAPMHARRLSLWSSAVLLLCALPVVAAPPTGWFGIRLDFDTDGRANPTVKSVTIENVFPDSPAARAHIARQDELVTVEGRAVAGAKAQELTELLHKAVGESLHLQLKHAGGELYEVVLTAVPLPDTRPHEPTQTTEGEHK